MGKLLVFITTVFLVSGLHWTARHEVKRKKEFVSSETNYFLKPTLFVIVPPGAEVTLIPLRSENAEDFNTFSTEGVPRAPRLIARKSMHPT